MSLSTGVFLNGKWTRPHRHRPERDRPRHFHGRQPSLPFFSSHVGATARTKSHHMFSRNPVSSPDPKSRFPLMLQGPLSVQAHPPWSGPQQSCSLPDPIPSNPLWPLPDCAHCHMPGKRTNPPLRGADTLRSGKDLFKQKRMHLVRKG